MGLQADEEDGRLHLFGPEDALQFPVIGHRLADGLGTLIDHVEGVVHRHVLAEAGPGQHPAALQHRAQVVAHAHLAHEFLGTGGDADLEVAHARGHHQLGQLGIEVVGPDVGRPADVVQPGRLDRPQQRLGLVDVAAGGDELGVGEPEATDPPVVELAHLRHHLLDGVHPDRLALHHGVDAVAAVVGATALGLDAHVEVTAIEVPLQLGPDRGDVVVVAGGLLHAGGLFVDQPGAWASHRPGSSVQPLRFSPRSSFSSKGSPSPTDTTVPRGSCRPSCS